MYEYPKIVKIGITILFIMMLFSGIAALQKINFWDIIWVYNIIYFSYAIYRLWFEENLIKNKLLNSDNLKVVAETNTALCGAAFKIQHNIKHWLFNKFELEFTKYKIFDRTEVFYTIKSNTLNNWFLKYFFGIGFNCYYSSNNKNDTFEEKYSLKILKYLENYKKFDRKRKLSKIL